MLQKNTVEKTTFELLTTLMNDSNLQDFFLVGGTNIALRLGHRKCIDLDLFTLKGFETTKLSNYLQKEYQFDDYDMSI